MNTKTKVITFNTPELRDDLTYVKYCVSEELSFKPRETPADFDVENEITKLKNNAISQSVSGKIISTSTKMVYDKIQLCYIEEVTINYEENETDCNRS